MSEEEEEQQLGAEAVLVPINYKDRTYRERIKEIRADRDKIKKATEALKALGFSVPVAEGVISLTIFGKRELFENIFQIKLNRIISKKGMDNSNKNNLSRKSSFNYYVSDKNVKIPKELEGLVYDVVFSMEPTFM
jgi:hypothetical protein